MAELICIRVDHNIVNPHYLLQLFKMNNYYLLINREKRGQTSHIYARDIKEIRIPLPDIETQNKNAENYQKQYKRYEDHLRKAEQIMEDTSAEFSTLFSV